MSPTRVLEHFERISEAPDAVPRLRRFILDLAVRGKLVEQDPKDEPAAELLKRVHAEKAVGARGAMPAGLPLPFGEELPFGVPGAWMWVRLSDITSYIQRGKSPQYAAGDGLPVVSQKCVQWSGLDLAPARLITRESITAYEDVRHLRDGDLLWNSTGTGTIGRIVRISDPPPRLVCDSHVTVVRCLGVDAEYVRSWLRSDHVYGVVEDRAAGSTNQVELTAQMANAQVVPLPPLAEQHRIVAKVDELMALCDRLEAAQTEREIRRDRLVAASLNRLNEPAADTDDAQPFRDHARFHLRHLPRLTTRPEHIRQLRQTILNLAVRGRLVPQDPNDEPVAMQLAASDRMREQTAKDDRRADAEPQTLLAEDDRWAVPASWEWRGLADLALFIDYRGQTPKKTEGGVRLITAKNVKRRFISPVPEEFLSEVEYGRWMTRGLPKAGDVLFTTEAPMGNAAVVRLTERFALAQRVICFRLYGALHPDFAALQILAEPFQAILDKTATGLTARGIKAAKLKRLPFAVPPLAEQHRIVAKVDELMAVCDRLEAQLTANHNEANRLLESAIHHAVTGVAQQRRVSDAVGA